MPLLWIAVAVSVAALVGSLVFLGIRAIRVWRGFRSFSAPLTDALAVANLDAPARRGCRGRAPRRARPPLDDPAPRRGGGLPPTPAAAADRARPQLPGRLPPRRRGAR